MTLTGVIYGVVVVLVLTTCLVVKYDEYSDSTPTKRLRALVVTRLLPLLAAGGMCFSDWLQGATEFEKLPFQALAIGLVVISFGSVPQMLRERDEIQRIAKAFEPAHGASK